MRNKIVSNKISLITIILSIILITSLSNVSALSSDGTILLLKNNITAHGISIIDSQNMFLTCINNGCDMVGENTSIVLYNYYNSSLYRRDIMNNGSYVRHYQNNTIDNVKHRNTQMFSSAGYYIFAENIAGLIYTSLYSYDFPTNTWILKTTAIDSNGGTNGRQYPVYTFNALSSSAKPNYTLFDIYTPDGSGASVPYQKSYNNQLQRLSFPPNIWVYQNINAKSSDSTYAYIYQLNNNLNIEHEYTPAIFPLTTQQFAVIDQTNNYYYITDTSDIIYGNLTDLYTKNITGVSLSNFETCANYINTYVFTDISCTRRDNCIFIGYENTTKTAQVIGFNGQGCVNYQDSMQQEFNTTNKMLFDVEYNTQSGDFIVVGESVIFRVTQYPFITPQCISPTTFCNNPINQSLIVNGQVTSQINCFFEDIQQCASGCSGTVCNNACSPETNPNNCNVLGSRGCYDSTQYWTCDDSNADGCFEKVVTPSGVCQTGSYCVDSFNYAGCYNVTQSGTSQPQGLSVIPYSVNDENTSYQVDGVTRTVSVSTTYANHIQNFYTSGTQFLSRTCDYKETLIYNNTDVTFVNVSNQTTFNNPVAQDSVLRTSFLPSVSGNGTIYLKSSLGNIISEIGYTRNASSKQICLYYANGTIIYCDYGIYGSDDLTSVDLEYTFAFTQQLYTIKVLFNRQTDNTIIVNPQAVITTDIYAINYTSSNTTVFNNQFVTVPQFTAFTGGIVSTSTFVPCIFSTKGLFKVRTYANTNGQPNYATYIDYNVNMVNYGLSQQQIQNIDDTDFVTSLFGTDLSTSTKLFYSVLVIFVTSLFIVIIGVYNGFPNALTTGLISITTILELILFVLIGFIPLWIMIVLLIVTAGILAVMAKSIFVSG